MAQSPLNGSTQPVDIEVEGRSPTTDRQWLIEKNNYKTRREVENERDQT